MEEREEEEEKEEEEKTIPIVAKQSYPLADGISRNERQGVVGCCVLSSATRRANNCIEGEAEKTNYGCQVREVNGEVQLHGAGVLHMSLDLLGSSFLCNTLNNLYDVLKQNQGLVGLIMSTPMFTSEVARTDSWHPPQSSFYKSSCYLSKAQSVFFS